MVLNFYDDPVIYYKFLNTPYSIVKQASDFWNYAALRFVVTEQNAAIMARNATHFPWT